MGNLTENLMLCVSAVMPMFMIMATGFSFKLISGVSREDVMKFNRMAADVFLPFLVFKNIYKADLVTAFNGKYIGYAMLASLLIFAIAAVVVLATVKETKKKGVLIQGVFRTNALLVLLPLANSFFDDPDLSGVFILMTITAIVYNLISVIILSIFNGEKVEFMRIVKSVCKNTVLIGCALGLVVNVCGIEFPAFCDTFVADMTSVATPLILFLTGAFFEFKGLTKYKIELTLITIGRLVLVPAITLFPAYFLGFRSYEFFGLLCLFASPPAAATFAMAQQSGGDAELAGNIVVVTSTFFTVSLLLYCFVFKTMGAF